MNAFLRVGNPIGHQGLKYGAACFLRLYIPTRLLLRHAEKNRSEGRTSSLSDIFLPKEVPLDSGNIPPVWGICGPPRSRRIPEAIIVSELL